MVDAIAAARQSQTESQGAANEGFDGSDGHLIHGQWMLPGLAFEIHVMNGMHTKIGVVAK